MAVRNEWIAAGAVVAGGGVAFYMWYNRPVAVAKRLLKKAVRALEGAGKSCGKDVDCTGDLICQAGRCVPTLAALQAKAGAESGVWAEEAGFDPDAITFDDVPIEVEANPRRLARRNVGKDMVNLAMPIGGAVAGVLAAPLLSAAVTGMGGPEVLDPKVSFRFPNLWLALPGAFIGYHFAKKGTPWTEGTAEGWELQGFSSPEEAHEAALAPLAADYAACGAVRLPVDGLATLVSRLTAEQVACLQARDPERYRWQSYMDDWSQDVAAKGGLHARLETRR